MLSLPLLITRHPSSNLALQRGLRCRPLQAGNGSRGRNLLGTALAAAHMRMTGVAAGVASNRPQSLAIGDVAHIVHQGPGAVQRRGTEVIRIPGNDVARAVADAAA